MERPKTRDELLLEMEEMRARLEEAEETLRAIRGHEVDALIAEGPGGQQVFTLQGAEQPYRVLVETMAEGALTMTPDGTILYCNSRLAELIGAPLNAIIGASLHDFVVSRDGQSLDAMLQTCGEAGCRGAFFLRTVDGVEAPVSLSARSLALNDVEAFCIVAADLTDQKRNQEALEKARDQLRQAQKMEALGTLSGGIAHDFNNILAAMIGFTELARSDVAEGSRQAHHLQRVFDAGLRGRELVRQMLTFSRKSKLEKKPLRLSSIVKETTPLLRASTPSTITIRVEVQNESGVILGDPVQIQQLLMNLCSNAAYVMRETGGVLDIEVSDFSVAPPGRNTQGIEPGLYMKLTVRDTGVGMAPDIMDKIFDPFFTTKKLGEGTGLGLSVVHGIVNQSGGVIRVESEPGKGSTFAVYFPKVSEGSVPAAVSQEALPTGSERILFIDDEEALVEMGEELLAELGYEVVSRTSSKVALALLKEDPSQFDLVITDQTMPDITGVELAKEMLALRPGMPVILCTGFSHTVDEEAAKAAGIRAFVMKPLTKKEIARTIRKVLDR